jgi:ketosteroid isomerase-like protein
VTPAADVVTAALDALRARDWEGLARRLHPDVVHRTPGVPEPILGREAFVMEGDTVVVIGEWTYTGLTGKVRQPSVSVVDVRDGQIWRDLEYVGLAI